MDKKETNLKGNVLVVDDEEAICASIESMIPILPRTSAVVVFQCLNEYRSYLFAPNGSHSRCSMLLKARHTENLKIISIDFFTNLVYIQNVKRLTNMTKAMKNCPFTIKFFGGAL